MSITFSSGGFDGTMRSDTSGNIFIETTGNAKTINIGGLQSYTGSKIQELDKSTGNVISSRELKSDGTIEKKQFSAAGVSIETKIKDPTKGKEFIRSGSATSNQIEFLQNSNGAFITVSGSKPGFNVINSSTPTLETRLIRRDLDTFISASRLLTNGFNTKNIGGFQYNFNPNFLKLRDANTLFTISSSGNVFVKNNLDATSITARSLNVTSITSSIVTSSIIKTEGSNIFGDAIGDTHTFNGNITASGNISASSDVNGKTLSVRNVSAVSGDGVHGLLFPNSATNQIQIGKSLAHVSNGTTIHGHITASGNISASGTSHIFGGTIETNTINASTIGAATSDVTFRGDNITITTDNTGDIKFKEQLTEVMRYDGGLNAFGIGTTTPSSKLTVAGDISASGIIYGKQKYYTHHAFSVNNTTNNFIPINNSLEASTNQSYHRWVAPYDGRFVKALVRGESAPNVSKIGFATASNGTEDPVLVAGNHITVNMLSADTSFEFAISSSTAQFNKGDALSVMFQSGNASAAGVNITCVWEYKVND